MKTVVAVLAVAMMAFLGGRASSPQPPAARPRGPVMAPTLVKLDVEPIRAAIRAELPPAPTPGCPLPAPVAEPAAPSAQFEAGRDVVAAARRHGRWTAEDAERLRDLMVTMSPDESLEAMAALAQAVNAQELVVETAPIL